jgi:hypothetical protein
MLGRPGFALPPPGSPAPQRSVGTTSPAGTVAELPYGAGLEFVLDDAVDSKRTAPGSAVRMHLRSALVLASKVVAPAGTPAAARVISRRPAQTPDIDGSVQVAFDSLPLSGGRHLPIRPSREFWTISQTAGKRSTGALTDAVKDIFIPGHFLYRNLLRGGRELHLPPGTVVRATTLASLSFASRGELLIQAPPPFALGTDIPHTVITPIPFATALPTPTPKAKPTPKPAPIKRGS